MHLSKSNFCKLKRFYSNWRMVNYRKLHTINSYGKVSGNQTCLQNFSHEQNLEVLVLQSQMICILILLPLMIYILNEEGLNDNFLIGNYINYNYVNVLIEAYSITNITYNFILFFRLIRSCKKYW